MSIYREQGIYVHLLNYLVPNGTLMFLLYNIDTTGLLILTMFIVIYTETQKIIQIEKSPV